MSVNVQKRSRDELPIDLSNKRQRLETQESQVQQNDTPEVEDESDELDEEEEDNDDEEDEEEGEEEEEDEEEDDDDESQQHQQLDDSERFKISNAYRKLNDKLTVQRSKLTTEEGMIVVKETLDQVENLFDNAKSASNTGILATDSATLKEIGEQAKIATQNVKFGKSEKMLNFETFVSSWINIFGTVNTKQQISANLIPDYNWANAGLLFQSVSKHVNGCDFLLGPLSIEKKKRIIRDRLIDDTRKGVLKTANLRNADDIKVDAKDDTSKAAEKLYLKLKAYGKRISLFETILHPTNFAKTVETLFVVSFLVNNEMLIMSTFENGIPYLELTTKENKSPFGKTHVIFDLDMPTWEKLVAIYKIDEPFFTNETES